MSFSKARIQRFNELGNEVPPPGAYDPKFEVKVKGLVIEKTERFQDNKSTGSAECHLSVSSKSTGNHPNATFRTPQLLRKRVIVKPTTINCPKAKGKSAVCSKDQKMKYEAAHQLADLQVECLNKDRTIQEHEKHIEEMKDEMRKLENQITELRRKQVEVEEQHKKDIETMAKLQQEILTSRDEKHQTETEILRSQLLEISEEKEREIQARKTTENELRNRVTELSKKISNLEAEITKRRKAEEVRVQTLEARIEELTIQLQKETSQLNMCVTDTTQERCNLEAKLEEKQIVILELQSEVDELKAEYDKLVNESIQYAADLTSKHDGIVSELRDSFGKEKEALLNENQLEKSRREEFENKTKEAEETNAFLIEELKDVQRLYKDVTQCLKQAQQELEDAEQKHALILKKHKEDLDEIKKLHDDEKAQLKQMFEDAKEEYVKELENLTLAKDKELAEVREASAKKIKEETRRMKEHADKIVENAEAVTRETLAACRAESEERVKRVILESDAKVNAMIREARNVVEEEMRLTAERYKSCLARVEMERTALDEKLAQKDAEINRLSATLEELKSSAETQESFSQSLQVELDKAETELSEKKEELRALKDQIRAEAAEMVARRKRFEVIMAENQASVVALTQRLAQSNAEVERLQYELKHGEDCIHEHRDLLTVMRNNSQLVHEQVRTLMEQLDAKKELVDQLEAGTFSEFESIKLIFEAKIENLKQVAAKEITRLQEECENKSKQNVEMKNQLDEMAERLDDAQTMLLKLEERHDSQMIEMSQMELVKEKYEKQLRKREEILDECKRLTQSESAQHKILNEVNALLEETRENVKRFEEKEHYLEDKVSMFEEEKQKWKTFEKSLIEELERERARREAAEEEVKRLHEDNDRLKKDYEEVSEKYADVIGHHNQKQKIKHVAQLKDKIHYLEQELQNKNRLVEQQQKTIEKLKVEEKRLRSKGKENLGLTKSAHTTPTSSPHKLLTPLRSRND